MSIPNLWLKVILAFTLSAFLASPAAFSQGKKTYTLAILDLVPNGISQVESAGLSDKLRIHISRLVKSPEYLRSDGKEWYTVVERTQVDKILEQFNIQNVCVSDSCAVEFGRMLQVDRIIIGSASLVGNTYSVTSRVIDVETGKTLAEADRQYKGSIDNVLNKVIMKVGDDLFNVKRKSFLKHYVTAGALITGASIYALTSRKSSASHPKSGALQLTVPDYPDEP